MKQESDSRAFSKVVIYFHAVCSSGLQRTLPVWKESFVDSFVKQFCCSSLNLNFKVGTGFRLVIIIIRIVLDPRARELFKVQTEDPSLLLLAQKKNYISFMEARFWPRASSSKFTVWVLHLYCFCSLAIVVVKSSLLFVDFNYGCALSLGASLHWGMFPKHAFSMRPTRSLTTWERSL